MQETTQTPDDIVLHAIESLLGARKEVSARSTRIVHDGQLEERGGTLEEARATQFRQDYYGIATFPAPVHIQNTKSTEVRGYDVEFYSVTYRQPDDGRFLQRLELSMEHEDGHSILLEIQSDLTDNYK